MLEPNQRSVTRRKSRWPLPIRLLTLEAAHEKGRVHRDLKPAKDMRLAREPRHAVDIGSERLGQNLDRHIKPKFGIRRAPHLAHPAFALAELRNNPVMRNDGLGGHLAHPAVSVDDDVDAVVAAGHRHRAQHHETLAVADRLPVDRPKNEREPPRGKSCFGSLASKPSIRQRRSSSEKLSVASTASTTGRS